MKRKEKTIFLLACIFILFMPNALFSQLNYEPNINGLYLTKQYTKAEIIQKLGIPDRYQKDTDESNGTSEEYIYSKSVFGFNNGILIRFNIKDNIFKLYNHSIIGSNISTLYSVLTPYGLVNKAFDDYNKMCLQFFNKYPNGIDYHDTPINIYYNSTGVITEFVFMELD